MAYQVLYRTYRPSKFSEVVGQEYIVKTLLNAIRNNKIAHAYLFAGPRGTGKTSVAKLFAKAINCENFKDEACDECPNCKAYLQGNHPDIIELDAASNNSVDDVREIIEQVPYAPLLGKYKVYIIDEVHMLSAQAFNALLKTIEEPPAHVIFIFATTDPQKVIPTVLSRCQRYNFSKINLYEIKKRTMEILDKEKIAYEEKAVEEIARLAEGGMRDALSLLEQCLAYNPEKLTLEDVEHIFGLTSTAKEVELYKNIHEHKISEVITTIRNMYVQGMDTKRLAVDLLDIIKDVLVYSDEGKESLLVRLTPLEAQDIINSIPISQLYEDAGNLEEAISREKQNSNFLTYLELCLIRMADSGERKEVKKEAIKETVKEEKAEEAKEETKEEIKEEVKEEVKEEIKEEPVEEKQLEEEINESFVVEPETDFLLSILLDANKDLKVADQIIYNKLDLYAYDSEKRKFYQLLIGTDLFASNKDAIIVSGNTMQVNNINTKAMNEQLYRFINDEFGIDKMIYAIDENRKRELINLYKQTPREKRNQPVYVEKYKLTDDKKEQSPEEKLKSLFGDTLKIEE
ncbi:MAG: DNA polymerase III subunit gamma/tau [Erysipelotrichaceae bacterium]|nr:DNA polymerase III subunit gamma/tau [Erysipelotrichaceae bacterium]